MSCLPVPDLPLVTDGRSSFTRLLEERTLGAPVCGVARLSDFGTTSINLIPESKPPQPRPTSYAGTAYWNDRYDSRTCNFDWFFTYNAVGSLIRRVLGPARDLPCLHVGCGNSTIQEGMVADGFVHVTNIDVSSVVIHQMQAQHGTSEALDYQVCDCRDMEQFPDGMFGSIVDKGTLDAVACGHGGGVDTIRYLKEVDRVLQPGGIFLLVSLGAPLARQNVIKGPPGSHWETEVLLLPKPALFLASEASMSGRVMAPHVGKPSSKDTPIETLGPFTQEQAIAKLSELHSMGLGREQHDFFFAYVIKKVAKPKPDTDAGEPAVHAVIVPAPAPSPSPSSAQPSPHSPSPVQPACTTPSTEAQDQGSSSSLPCSTGQSEAEPLKLASGQAVGHTLPGSPQVVGIGTGTGTGGSASSLLPSPGSTVVPGSPKVWLALEDPFLPGSPLNGGVESKNGGSDSKVI